MCIRFFLDSLFFVLSSFVLVFSLVFDFFVII